MGSIISLGINKLEIDWGKNQYFTNHSKLFNKSDIHNENYYYANDYVEQKAAYSAPLSKIKLRLELLGYTLNKVRNIYISNYKWHEEEYSRKPPLTFDQFSKAIKEIQINNIHFNEDDEYPNDHDFGRYFEYCIKDKLKIKNSYKFDKLYGQFYENLDPYVVLRLIIENRANLDEKLIWRFLDIVEGGYVKQDELYEKLSDSDKYLIVTEGTSDLFILGKSMDLLYPDITDFFSYIDMEDNYPFTGSGNLYKFVQGLVKINPLNKILIIFDNDAEGIEKYDQCKKLKLPMNIKIIKLPSLADFNKFLTIGPSGSKKMNINESGVSIECFLDLDYVNYNKPAIRWTLYKSNLNRYQGSLENKEKYIKLFKKINKRNDTYNFSKLQKLLDYIITECINMNDDYPLRTQ